MKYITFKNNPKIAGFQWDNITISIGGQEIKNVKDISLPIEMKDINRSFIEYSCN